MNFTRNDMRLTLFGEEALFQHLNENGIVVFADNIDADSTDKLSRRILIAPSPTVLIIQSEGGQLDCALGLYELLLHKAQQGPLVTLVNGYCYSSAMILLTAGTTRIAPRYSSLLIHEVSQVSAGKSSEVTSDVKFMQRLEDCYFEILASRSKLSARQIASRVKGKNWWFNGDEAVKYGFADTMDIAEGLKCAGITDATIVKPFTNILSRFLKGTASYVLHADEG